MKSAWRLLVAVVILAVVIGVLYWPRKPETVAAAKPLVAVTSSAVQRISITQPDQPEVVLTKAGSDWKLDQPYAFAADSATVSSLLNSLGNITGAEDVGSGSNAAAFGLDKPSTVALGLSDGRTLAFEFGSDTPTGGNSYLRLGDGGAVKMVPSDVKQNAVKTAFSLQDKSIVHFPSGQLTALDVTNAGKKAHFDKGKDGWPKDQQSNIQSLLDALQDGQMTAMPDPAGKATAADGLDHPSSSLTLTWNGGTVKLDLGAKKGAAEYYARNSSGPAIFTLSDYLQTDVANLVAPAKPALTVTTKK
ncbi:MAG TPA: DUF4340 domain-containing protein [Terriglobales bacterium]|nr:DUF4340 domain-containing protein [Terriglobales bacterium]